MVMMTKMIMSRGKTKTDDDDDDACNSNFKSCNIDFLILKVTLGNMERYKDWEPPNPWEASSPSKSSESSNRWNKCCCII